MAAISSIRKHGVLLMIVIGFALLLFLLTGLFDNNTLYRAFASDKITQAKVDGEVVDNEYNVLRDQLATLLKLLQDKTSLTDAESFQAHQLAWDQLVTEKLLAKQMKGLGIVYNDEMVENIMSDAKMTLTTQQPNQFLMSLFQYLVNRGVSPEFAQAFITSPEEYKDANPEIYAMYEAIQRRLVFEHQYSTYLGMAQGVLYFSDALAKKSAAENTGLLAGVASFSSSLPAFNDITVTPTDKEMKDWYNQNKKRYKTIENMRDIDVAVLPILPTVEDKTQIEAEINAMYERFSTVSTIDSFNLQYSFSMIDSSFHKIGDNLVLNTKDGYTYFNNIPEVDSLIFNRTAGTNIEPFVYQDNIWFFGKSISVTQRPDSIRVAFLILDFKNASNPNSLRTKSQARQEADSLISLMATGQATIFSLLPNYMGGRQAGADTTYWLPDVQYQQGDIFSAKLYTNLVKLQDGALYRDDLPGAFLVYQVLERTAPIEKRQYTLYAHEIVPSEATITALRAQAGQIAAASTSAEELLKQANEQGVQIVNGTSVTSMMASVGQLQNCRAIVSWAFGEDVEKNAVSDVFKLEEGLFAVATVKLIRNQGVPAFEDVKEAISQELTAKKKVEAIEAKLKEEMATGTSFAEIARKYNVNYTDSANLVFMNEFYMNAGVENGAIGKIFANTAEKKQVVSGNTNVYLVNILAENPSQDTGENLQMAKSLLRNVCLGRGRSENIIIEGLKEKMNIWDNRARFFPN